MKECHLNIIIYCKTSNDKEQQECLLKFNQLNKKKFLDFNQ